MWNCRVKNWNIINLQTKKSFLKDDFLVVIRTVLPNVFTNTTLVAVCFLLNFF